MANRKKALTTKEAKELGIDTANIAPGAIPENISPVLKADLLKKWQDQQEGDGVKFNEAFDGATATERGNAMVRQRAEAEKGGADSSESYIKRQNDAAN